MCLLLGLRARLGRAVIYHDGVPWTWRRRGIVWLGLLPLVAFAPARGLAGTIVCPHVESGPAGFTGFYVTNVPGVALASVQLFFYGNFQVTTIALTARRDRYDGPVLGTAHASAWLSQDSSTPLTFDFGSLAVTPGSIVTFVPTVVTESAFAAWAGAAGPCPDVVQTIDTTPPLSTPQGSLGVTVVFDDVLTVPTLGWGAFSILALLLVATALATLRRGPFVRRP
jgi:hypothetical protein